MELETTPQTKISTKGLTYGGFSHLGNVKTHFYYDKFGGKWCREVTVVGNIVMKKTNLISVCMTHNPQ